MNNIFLLKYHFPNLYMSTEVLVTVVMNFNAINNVFQFRDDYVCDNIVLSGLCGHQMSLSSLSYKQCETESVVCKAICIVCDMCIGLHSIRHIDPLHAQPPGLLKRVD